MKCDKLLKKILYCHLNDSKPKLETTIDFYKKYILEEEKEIKSKKTKNIEHIIRRLERLDDYGISASVDTVLKLYKIINEIGE